MRFPLLLFIPFFLSCGIQKEGLSKLRANQAYVINEDIDLKGRLLVIPKGVTLVFRGGSFSNGKIEGDETIIEVEGNVRRTLFSQTIELSGTFKADEAFSEWFGLIPDCEIDNEFRFVKGTDNIKGLKNMFLFPIISLSRGSFFANGGIQMIDGQIINGNGAILKMANGTLKPHVAFWVNGSEESGPVNNVLIQDLTIIGDKNENNVITQYAHGIYVGYAKNVTIKNVKTINNRGDGIYIGGQQKAGGDNMCPANIILDHIFSFRNHRQGLSVSRCDNLLVEDSEFSETSGTSPCSGLDIEPLWSVVDKWYNECKHIRFVRCKFRDNDSPVYISDRFFISEEQSQMVYDVSFSKCEFLNNGISIYGSNVLKITDCKFENGGIFLVAKSKIRNINISNINIEYNSENNGSGFQLSLFNEECRNISLSNVNIKGCGVWGVYITAGDKDGTVDGFSLKNVVVSNCSNSVSISNSVKNVVYDNLQIFNTGVDAKGRIMKSRYGNNIHLRQLDDEETRLELNIQPRQ